MIQNTTYHEMPQECFPVHLFFPEFKTLGMWFPALDAWVLEMLCRKLRDKRQHKLDIMEIGTFVGGSAAIFDPHAEILVCADTWAGSGKYGDEMVPLYQDGGVLETFLSNTNQFLVPMLHSHRRTMNPDSLPAFLAEQVGRRFDLIFIDGGHDYDSVVADIAVAKNWIAPDGILCGHDFTMFDGVTKAVLEFGDEVGNVNVCGTVWWKEM